MTELFEVEESLSPRLKWMQKHKIQVELNKHLAKAKEFEPWEAWIGDTTRDEACQKQLGEVGDIYGPYYAAGATEEEALFWMAKSNGLKLWNEEGAE